MTQRHPVQNDLLTMVTTNTLDRQPIFRDPSYAREAVECLYRVQELHPFFLYGFVIMPDHCHILMTVPIPETLSNIIGAFKSGLTFDLGLNGGCLWQRRFHATIVNNSHTALRYIYRNPVRAGLAGKQEDYPWSSACGQWTVMPLDGL